HPVAGKAGCRVGSARKQAWAPLVRNSVQIVESPYKRAAEAVNARQPPTRPTARIYNRMQPRQTYDKDTLTTLSAGGKGVSGVARLDQFNRAKFWVDQDLSGVSLLRAAFRTLSFAPHVHNELVIAVTEE